MLRHPCRGDIVRLVCDLPPDGPAMQSLRYKFMFAPIAEVGVERKHAEVSKTLRTAPHHAPPLVSVSLRRRLVEHSCLNIGSELLALERHCSQLANNAAMCARRLGLGCHPAFSDHIDPDTHSLQACCPCTLVAAVLYRCDLGSQYLSLPGPDVSDGPPPADRPERPVGSGPAGGGVRDSGNFDALLAQACFDHFRTTCTPGTFYSVPLGGGGSGGGQRGGAGGAASSSGSGGGDVMDEVFAPMHVALSRRSPAADSDRPPWLQNVFDAFESNPDDEVLASIIVAFSPPPQPHSCPTGPLAKLRSQLLPRLPRPQTQGGFATHSSAAFGSLSVP